MMTKTDWFEKFVLSKVLKCQSNSIQTIAFDCFTLNNITLYCIGHCKWNITQTHHGVMELYFSQVHCFNFKSSI